MVNKVFIASSLDGFIATKDGQLDWLENISNPSQSDFGYAEFISTVDAIVMGRKTFESIGKPLPKRLNVVLTKDKDFRPEHCLIFDRVEDVIKQFAEEPQVFVIGGGEIYKQFFHILHHF